MSITFHEGPNLSGRSDALRAAAWGDNRELGGTYLFPDGATNLSGLALTVGGERFLHDLHDAQPVRHDPAAMELIRDLPARQRLSTLSGGQQARLALACALARDPPVLAIDGLLEQLDVASRGRIAEMLAARRIVALADNYGSPFLERAIATVRHRRRGEGRSINAALADLAWSIEGGVVRAPVIEIAGLSFRYGRSQSVFHNANFRFVPGRAYLLRAPNGAGKSTLARILLGVERFQAGRLLIDGSEYRPWRSSRNLLFQAFQRPRDQLFGPSVRGYLERLTDASKRRDTFLEGTIDIAPDQLLRAAALEPFADLEPFELPWLIAKRVSVLAALASRSPWLFLDEPSLGSDAEGRASLALLVHRLAAAGFGIIVVSHGEEFDHLPEAVQITIRDCRIVVGETDD